MAIEDGLTTFVLSGSCVVKTSILKCRASVVGCRAGGTVSTIRGIVGYASPVFTRRAALASIPIR